MNTDDTDFGERGGEDGREEVEFVPVPGGYGFHRVRLGIEPRLTGERKPPQGIAQPGAAVPHEHAEVHAILG
jgi:hypothetical protein